MKSTDYVLRLSRGVRSELRHAARSELARAIDAVRATDRPLDARVHDVRTALKKVRSLLGLVRHTMKGAHREERLLGALARRLAPVRDAAIVRRRLRTRATGATDAKAADLLEHLERPLRRARRRVRRWAPRPGGFQAIEEGLVETYRRARRLAPIAFASQGHADLHALRKLVKRELHHAQWLFERLPEVERPRIRALARLDALLGDDHDISITELAAPLARRPRLAARHVPLRARACDLATQLFDEPPSAFRRRLRQARPAKGLP